jgi:predicted nucleic acid-binding protein
MSDLVIADTSCLIVLQKINRLTILKELFNSISITPDIYLEFGQEIPEWIVIREIKDKKKKQLLQLELDEGEAGAIVLAMENEGSLLLIDERKGRKVASDLGLNIMGTLGVIIKAKELKMIDSLSVEIDKMKAANFRMSEKLIKQIIRKYD